MFRKLHDPVANAVTIILDGAEIEAEPGESLAAVLLREVNPWCRVSPISLATRGPYCMMGVCFDCLAEVDGVHSVQTCQTIVRGGMRVSRLNRKRSV